MEEELDLGWSMTPYFLDYEMCPIKLIASMAPDEATHIDEVMIYSDQLWSSICRYKGSITPFAQIRFEVDGK